MIDGKPEPELTAEQLRIAFREMYRPGRPETVEAMLADPVLGPCLRGRARQRSRAPIAARPHHSSLPVAPIPPTAPTAPEATLYIAGRPVGHVTGVRIAPLKRSAFDAKKARANDLDD